MKLNRIHSILLLTALLHLFADSAVAGGVVLCVGPNDHAAIEAAQVARECGPSRDQRASSDVREIEIGARSSCIDIPLHSDSELASKDCSWEPDPPQAVALSWTSASLIADGRQLPIGKDSDRTPAMRVHRNIVLII